jgi:hypothetical protein
MQINTKRGPPRFSDNPKNPLNRIWTKPQVPLLLGIPTAVHIWVRLSFQSANMNKESACKLFVNPDMKNE